MKLWSNWFIIFTIGPSTRALENYFAQLVKCPKCPFPFLLAAELRGSTYPPPPTGPNQISLTQITNHQKKKKKKRNSPITKILMYYEGLDSRFHAALWSCRERFTC